MIDFRYHLVSIVAVFLALTVGLVLGTTMLQDPLLHTLKSETADLRGQTEDLREERDVADKVNAGADEMAEAVSEDVLDGRLYDLGVVVVTAPGADPEVAEGLAARVEEAGGEIVGRVGINETFLESGNADFVDELSIQVSDDPDGLSGGPYEKAGTEIGRALVVNGKDVEDGAGEGDGDGEGDEKDGGHDASSVLEAFTEGGLVIVEGEPAGAADAVVFVAPAAGADVNGDDREAANAVLATVTSALYEEVGAAVLAGDVPSSRGHGTIAQARAEEPAFATVDVTGRPMGDIIVVLALAENLEEDGGAYGIGDGVQGFLPDPLPTSIEPSGDGLSDGEGSGNEDSGDEDSGDEDSGSEDSGSEDSGGEAHRSAQDGEGHR